MDIWTKNLVSKTKEVSIYENLLSFLSLGLFPKNFMLLQSSYKLT